MVNDLTGEKKANKEAILEAINSLKQRGCDVNPYSIANETGIPRQLISRDSEFMRLLAIARGEHSNGAPSAAPAQSDAAQARIKELEAYNATLRQRIQSMQAELTKVRAEAKTPHPVDASLHEELGNLQSENTTLREQISKLKEEVQSASKSVNIAWQQGYLAGQHAAAEEAAQQKTFIDTLAEAAQAATTYGAEAEQEQPVAVGATADADEATAETTTQPALIPSELQLHDAPMDVEEIAPAASFIVEALHIDDPEVLNDPFTAKLLGALSADLETEVLEAVEEIPAIEEAPPENGEVHLEFEDVSIDELPLDDPDLAPQASSEAVDEFNCEPDGLIEQQPQPEAEEEEPEQLQEDQEDLGDEEDKSEQGSVREQMEDTTTFSAEELHSLFRNKYVRPDADPAEARDPSVSGTFPAYKKFVGTNKSSTEPLPTMPRVFSPEIRKACRLLGLNPEEMTRASVTEAWKNQMAKPGVHPDTGGDTEMAIYLNTAKDTLMRWIDDQTPKLGKKFGTSGTREQSKPKQKTQE